MHEPRRRTQIKRYGHDEAIMDISDLESSSGAETDNDNDTSLGVGRGRGELFTLLVIHSVKVSEQ